ncbi:MAG: glycerophosphodiester phosphodiesterase, partial [Spirochaetota bacterium]
SRHGAALAERCAISSFNPWAIARFRALDGSIPVGIIWHNHGEMPAFLRHGEGRWIGHADFLKPSRKLVRASSSWRWRALEGFEFLVWTVDEAAEAHRLVDLHASGIISNRADGLGLPIVGP